MKNIIGSDYMTMLQVAKNYISNDIMQSREKMRGHRNITLYIPRRISFPLEEGDLQQLKIRNIEVKRLED